MGAHDAAEVVAAYWSGMRRNDWHRTAELFDDSYELVLPQTGELVRGRINWIAIQEHSPPAPTGPRYHVHRTVTEAGRRVGEGTVVSDFTVAQQDTFWRCISFTEVAGGRIIRQTEFWSEDSLPPAWRCNWTEPLPEPV